MKADEQRLKQLLRMNFEEIFNGMDLFVDHIPDMAKMIGLDTFMNRMGFRKSKYYHRLKHGNWTREELRKCMELFQEYNLGTRN